MRDGGEEVVLTPGQLRPLAQGSADDSHAAQQHQQEEGALPAVAIDAAMPGVIQFGGVRGVEDGALDSALQAWKELVHLRPRDAVVQQCVGGARLFGVAL